MSSATLAERIRSARQNAGLSQAGLGKRMGVTRVAVTQWEGGTSPSALRLRKLARVLGVSYTWLVEGKEPEGQPLPVLGRIAAGVWRELPTETIGYMPITFHPAYPTNAQYGLRVEDNSVNKIARDGEFLLVVDCSEAGITLRDGDLVVIERRRHGLCECTVKRLRITDPSWTLVPETSVPELSEPIVANSKDHDSEIVYRAVVIGRYGHIPRGPLQ